MGVGGVLLGIRKKREGRRGEIVGNVMCIIASFFTFTFPFTFPMICRTRYIARPEMIMIPTFFILFFSRKKKKESYSSIPYPTTSILNQHFLHTIS